MLDSRVTKVTQSRFAQLRQLRTIKPFLSHRDLEKVIHAFISSRLDHCNSLYSGISAPNVQRLQLPFKMLLPGFERALKEMNTALQPFTGFL